MPDLVTVCSDCMSADCGGERGRLLIDITREQYDTRANVCPYCDRVNCDACEENSNA